LSELERCLREINSFLKFQDMIFELVDEAKIDVYKIKGFNTTLASAQGMQLLTARFNLANMLKNFNNAIAMDADDDYNQKQLGTVFNGLANIYEQMRMNLAAAIGMPLDKLFGQSASGLNANGEDTIEAYNSLVETVRVKAEPLLKWAIGLRCRSLFGFAPEFKIEWPKLRVLSDKEQEEVNTSKQNRLLSLYDRGLLTPETLDEGLAQDGLISVELESEPIKGEEDGTDGSKKPGSKGGDDKKRENAIQFPSDGLAFLRAEKRRVREEQKQAA